MNHILRAVLGFLLIPVGIVGAIAVVGAVLAYCPICSQFVG